MQHPDPIGVGLANEISFECGGSDCLIPGLVRPTRVLGLQVTLFISLVARSVSMLLERAVSRFIFPFFCANAPRAHWRDCPLCISHKALNGWLVSTDSYSLLFLRAARVESRILETA